jgi:hypothetical protein
MKAIATENTTLEFNNGLVISVSPPVLMGMGFQKVKASGSAVLQDKLSITVPSFSPGPSDSTTGIPADNFVMNSTAQKVKAGGTFVLLEGDESSPVSVTWANAPPNIPSRTAIVTCTIKLSGQMKVSAQ